MAETQSAGKKIWISVAGGLILSFILYVTPWLRENVLIPCGKGLWRVIAAFGHHLVSSATVPWWLLWILIALSAYVLLRVLALVRGKVKAADQDSPQGLNRENFRRLVYEGIRWIWKYGFTGNVIEIVALCPICSYQLDLKHDARPNPHTMIGLSDVTIYWCDYCKVVKGQLDGNQRAITIRVHKEVLRLFNSGEWENVVRQQMAARSTISRSFGCCPSRN